MKFLRNLLAAILGTLIALGIIIMFFVVIAAVAGSGEEQITVKNNSVLEYLSTLSQKKLAEILENDSDLAATMAAADLITKLMRPTSTDI